jgi:superfamily II DNA or RNA helicase
MNINLQREKLQTEAFDALEEVGFNGMFILPTGSGKGKVLVDIIKALDPKSILYVCDNKNLRDKDFPAELRKWDAAHYIDRINFQCYQTTYKWNDKYYELLLADEADYAMTEEYSKVFFNNTFNHTVLTSATLADEKREMAKTIVPIVYEKIISDIVDDKVVNKEQVYFVNYMLSDAENKRYLAFNEQFKTALNKAAVNQKQIQYIQRNRKLFMSSLISGKNNCIDLLKRLHATITNKILVFCSLTDQADKITRYTYHTKNEGLDNLSKFNAGEIRVIAIVGKVDRGQNLNGVNNIVFESPMESRTKFVQKSGRGRRLHVDDILNMYFLIPYYKDVRGTVQPTIVQKWVLNSTKDLDLSTAKIYKL